MGGGSMLPFPTRIASMSTLLIVGIVKYLSYGSMVAICFLSFILFYYAGVGLLFGHLNEYIIQDIKSYAFVLIAPILNSLYKDFKSGELILEILKVCGTIISLIHIILISLLFFDNSSAISTAKYLESSDELRFRIYPTLVIKANIFGALALVIAIAMQKKFDGKLIFVLIINFVSIALTLTRGFYIATLVSLTYLFLLNLRFNTRLIFLAISPIILLKCITMLLDLDFFEARGESDSDRLGQVNSVMEYNSNIFEFLFGQGFGSLINNSPKSEIFILEYFTKFGALMSSIFIIYSSTQIIKNLFAPPVYKFHRAYAAVLVFILIQSLTNSYITNNIGGIILIITIIHLSGTGGKILRGR